MSSLKINGKTQGNANVTLTSKAEGAKATSVVLPVSIVDSSKKLYTKYTFSIESCRFNGYEIDSNVLSGEANTNYFLLSGSAEVSDGLYRSGTAPAWEFDDAAFAEYFVQNLDGETPNVEFYWTTLLANVSNHTGNQAYALRSWDATNKGFTVRRTLTASSEY